jgi:hypothetical protein
VLFVSAFIPMRTFDTMGKVFANLLVTTRRMLLHLRQEIPGVAPVWGLSRLSIVPFTSLHIPTFGGYIQGDDSELLDSTIMVNVFVKQLLFWLQKSWRVMQA